MVFLSTICRVVKQSYTIPSKDFLELKSPTRLYRRLQFKRLAAVCAISFRDQKHEAV